VECGKSRHVSCLFRRRLLGSGPSAAPNTKDFLCAGFYPRGSVKHERSTNVLWDLAACKSLNSVSVRDCFSLLIRPRESRSSESAMIGEQHSFWSHCASRKMLSGEADFMQLLIKLITQTVRPELSRLPYKQAYLQYLTLYWTSSRYH
jgi:hypothetical protein